MSRKINSHKRYGYLDSTRGIAILLVIIVHISSGININASTFIDSLLHSGNKGVQLFFMLSGFTLCLQYYNNNENKKWLYFYIKRIFRILPLWILMIPVYILFRNESSSLYDILGTAFFINGFFVHEPILINGGWSIFVEVIFYALFPIFILLGKTITRSFISLFILIIISLLWRKIALENNIISLTETYIYEFPITHLFCFIFGIFLYNIKNIIKSINISYRNVLIFDIFAFTFCIYLLPQDITLACIGFSLIFISCFLEKGLIFNFFERNKWLQKIGECSYGMYIAHFIVIKLTRYFDIRGLPIIPPILENGAIQIVYLLIYTIEVTFITFCISWIIYNIYELKFISLGRTYIRKLKGKNHG